MTDRPKPRLRLLTREGCHLCDEMAEEVVIALEGRLVGFSTEDVDADPELRRKYGLRVPVLLDEWNEPVCEGRFDPDAFGEFLGRLPK